jgi:CrcB protein
VGESTSVMILWVFLGGGVGSVCRYLIGRALPPTANGFPIGTLAVNVLGCLLVGLLARFVVGPAEQPMLRAALIVGFCGGFTTFSAFSYETVSMMISGRWIMASSYVATSVVACLLGTAIALRVGR